MKVNKYLIMPVFVLTLLLVLFSKMLSAAVTCPWSTTIGAQYERKISHLEKPQYAFVYEETIDKHSEELIDLHNNFLKSLNDFHDLMYDNACERPEESVAQINEFVDRINKLQDTHQAIKTKTHGMSASFGRVPRQDPSFRTLDRIKQINVNINNKVSR